MDSSKSDFAKKLLGDLRLRKERMAAAQNSTRNSAHIMSREKHGSSSGRTFTGSQRSSGMQSVSRTSNANGRSNRSSRGASFAEPSNQIVLYERGQSAGQVKDLSTAIAFAFENSGNILKIGAAGNIPLVNFLNRFGRKSMDFRKMDVTGFDNGNQFPAVSQIHITEISKGVQKINQILRACAKGINFDSNSFEVGKELLKGSTDLEESLRLFVNLQEAAAYRNGSQQKNRIKFLDEDEDDQEDTDKTMEHWQLSQPRYSFHNTSRNASSVQGTPKNSSKRQQDFSNKKIVAHQRSKSYDYSSSTVVKQNNNLSSKSSTQEKGRVSNVIAKLMGLDELPQKENSTVSSQPKEGSQRKVLGNADRDGRKGDKDSHQVNNSSVIRDAKLQRKPEKIRETVNERSKLVSEGNKMREDSSVQAVLATTLFRKQQSHAIASNQTEELQNGNYERGRRVVEVKERKAAVLKSDPPQVKKSIKALENADVQHKRPKHSANEKRNADKNTTSNQQARVQARGHKKSRDSERKQQAEEKNKQLEKRNLLQQKREGDEAESMISSKPKKMDSGAEKMKLLHDISSPDNVQTTKSSEKVLKTDNKNRDDAKAIAAHEEEDKNQNLSPGKLQLDRKEERGDLLRQEKPIPVSVNIISQKVENRSKIDAVVTKRNASVSSKSVKLSANMLQDFERHMRSKTHIYRRKEQQSDIKDKDAEVAIVTSSESETHMPKREEQQSISKDNDADVAIITTNASDISTEILKQPDEIENEAQQTIEVDSLPVDECQTHDTPTSPTKNDNCNDHTDPGEVSDYLQTVNQPREPIDEQGLTQCDQTSNEEDTELYSYKQFPTAGKQEHLTEQEKEFKETVIKSQMFLNTAEAFFKLNIPTSLLHSSDHNNEPAGTKLVVDCGYEIMKRKAKRREATLHPYMRTSISCKKLSSLDDLVKQLCKDIEALKSYGGDGSDIAECLHTMLNNDINDKEPDINSMWDFEWDNMKSVFLEKEDVVKDVEKHMLNGLLNEITSDLWLVHV